MKLVDNILIHACIAWCLLYCIAKLTRYALGARQTARLWARICWRPKARKIYVSGYALEVDEDGWIIDPVERIEEILHKSRNGIAETAPLIQSE